MSDLKEFRSIADGVMSDITADSRLKEITLKRCGKKGQAPVGKLIAAAACFVLIMGTLNFSGLLKQSPQTEIDTNPGIFMAESEPGILATGQEDTVLPGSTEVTGWEPESLEEARNAFGGTFLLPSYIPEHFTFQKAYASGDGNRAHKIILQYGTGERTFIIIENKLVEMEGFTNFEEIEINGVKGYRKAAVSDTGDSMAVLDTEVHWFAHGVHYSVSGQITGQEAVKIAEAMK